MAEPPYGILWKRMKVGRIMPFLGAMASLVGRKAGTEWTGKADLLPSVGKLAHYFADQAAFPSAAPRDREHLARVTS